MTYEKFTNSEYFRLTLQYCIGLMLAFFSFEFFGDNDASWDSVWLYLSGCFSLLILILAGQRKTPAQCIHTT